MQETSLSLQPIRSIHEIDVSSIGSSNCNPIGKYLFDNFFQFKDSELRKASEIATKIRNLGLLSSITNGITTVLPLAKELHIWNAALQSKFFEKCGLHNKENVTVMADEYDQSSLAWIVDYLESSDEVRKKCLDNESEEMIVPLLTLADKLEMPRLRAIHEVKLLKEAPLPEEFLKSFESYDTRAFPLLDAFLFLTKLFSLRKSNLFFDDEGQKEASKQLCRDPTKTLIITLEKRDLPYIDKMLSYKGSKLDFSIDPQWIVSDDECDQLLDIAKKSSCKNFTTDLLKIKFGKMGCKALKPGALKYFVDGFSYDNYYPGDTQINTTERYQKQKSFFKAPYPVKNLDLVVFFKNQNPEALAFIREFSHINFGISFSCLPSDLDELVNVTLLAFEGTVPDCESRSGYYDVLGSFPECKTLVLNPEWVSFFNDKAIFSKYTISKNLTGDIKRIAKLNFSYDWVRSSSTYS